MRSFAFLFSALLWAFPAASSFAIVDPSAAASSSSETLTSASYFVGDGEAFDFSLEVLHGKDAFLYLTKKPLNEPVVDAAVLLQPGSGGGGNVKFVAVKDAPGTYQAALSALGALPGQIIIQTATDTDVVETVIPKYKMVHSPPASTADAGHDGPGRVARRDLALAFAAGGITFSLLGVIGLSLRKRRRQGGLGLLLAAAVTLPPSCEFNKAFAHGGHDHGGPAMDTDADSGGDVVMPKKSQLLIDLRTIPAKKEAVPGVIKTYGHIIPKPQLDAVITAPQTGFLRGTQGLSLGTKVRRGQLLGTLQSVGPIRLDSPIDGEISELYAVEGTRVEAGGKLFRVTNPSTLWVDAEMFARQLVELSHVTAVTVAVEGVSEPVKARLLNAVSPVSEETRTAKVFLELVAPPPTLHMGMLATVSFALERKTEAIPMPASAILNRAGDRIVFVQTGPETFVSRLVTVEDGPTSGTVLVTQGVKDGDRVVVSGNYQLLMKAK